MENKNFYSHEFGAVDYGQNYEQGQDQEQLNQLIRSVGRGALNAAENQVADKSEVYEEIGSNELFDIFAEDSEPSNMIDINLAPAEAEAWLMSELQTIRSTEKGEHAKIGVVSGSFDVPHENHTWYLRHCKALLAEKMCIEQGWEVNKEMIRDIIAEGLVKLVVAVDTDQEVSRRKTKDGDVRPIYHFYDRARRISELTIGFGEDRVSVADFVVPEGPEYSGSSLERLPDLASLGKENGLIDEFITFGEHPKSAEEARSIGFDPITIPTSVYYASSPITGEAYSSSAIIKKIRNGGQE